MRLHKIKPNNQYVMEESFNNVCDNLDFSIRKNDKYREEARLDGAIDLVIKTRTGKIQHLVEFKRHIGLRALKRDAVRLAWLCLKAPINHRAESNYLIAVTHASHELLKGRQELLNEHLKDVFKKECFRVTFKEGKFGDLKSTKPKHEGKTLIGGVWKISYVDK